MTENERVNRLLKQKPTGEARLKAETMLMKALHLKLKIQRNNGQDLIDFGRTKVPFTECIRAVTESEA